METMISRVKGMMLEPRATWKEIDTEFTKPGETWGKYIIPLAAIGPIEAVGADSVTVAGKAFKVDSHTVIVRGGTNVSLASLVVGETAEVKAAVSSDGTVVALFVRVQASK